jgi:hypothetical protein
LFIPAPLIKLFREIGPMERWFRRVLIAVASLASGLTLMVVPAAGQVPAGFPRTPEGKPDLSGIWQALNTANWNIQAHAAQAGSVSALGAIGAVPPGEGVVEGGEIPYLPAAAAQQKANYEKRWTADPELKCYMPGVPRATYMPYPFQIVQGSNTVLISYQYAGAVRLVNMNKPGPSPADSWMGWSAGRWDGDTLVIDVTSLNDQTWFDRAGNFHSDALHVVERYTPRSSDTLSYEATIEDPKVFSRPWKMSMPLYRHVEKNAHMMEFKCIEFAEDILYGHLRKK